MTVKTLYQDKWLSLKAVENEDEWGEGSGSYTFAHETRCNGEIVAVLPYRVERDGSLTFLLRSEIVPCWGYDPCIVSITGGVEGNAPAFTAVHELEEEAGLKVKVEELIPLGACRGTKSVDTVYHLFAVDATGKERGPADGDGSVFEKMAHCFWSKNVHDAVDPLVFTMVYRLMLLVDSGDE